MNLINFESLLLIIASHECEHLLLESLKYVSLLKIRMKIQSPILHFLSSMLSDVLSMLFLHLYGMYANTE